MPAPTVVGASGALGTIGPLVSGGQLVVDIPHAAGDLLVMFHSWAWEPQTGFWSGSSPAFGPFYDPGYLPLEVASDAEGIWTPVNANCSIATAASGTATNIKVRRITSGSFSEAIVYAYVVVHGGALDASATRFKLGDDTSSVSFPAVTTSAADCLILQALTHSVFNNSAFESPATFAGHAGSISGITEQLDYTEVGAFLNYGMNVISGTLAAAGSTGATTATATVTNSGNPWFQHAHELGYVTLALAPHVRSGWLIGAVDISTP